VGFYSVLNGAGGIEVGEESLIAGFVNLQASSHAFHANKSIKSQPSSHQPISIGPDVWIGAHSVILENVQIGRGSIIGANSVVNKNVPEYQIWAGCPASFLKIRQ
jgi:acetyltransferase-like isoleucine patch superfamily enzyme